MHLINNGECRQLPRFYSENKKKNNKKQQRKKCKGDYVREQASEANKWHSYKYFIYCGYIIITPFKRRRLKACNRKLWKRKICQWLQICRPCCRCYSCYCFCYCRADRQTEKATHSYIPVSNTHAYIHRHLCWLINNDTIDSQSRAR